MTEREAIKKLKIDRQIEKDNYRLPKDNYYDLAIAALEKQIGKKPNKQTYKLLIEDGWDYECPCCRMAIGVNNFVANYTDEDKFCPSCGQRIDWSDTK